MHSRNLQDQTQQDDKRGNRKKFLEKIKSRMYNKNKYTTIM